MVAIFKTGSSLKTTLNYNENKVRKGVAECIHAENYPLEHHELNFHHKLNMLLKYASLNKNVKANSVHISLNFDPSERLSNEQLKEIANAYMQQVGFGEQPYLVYRHEDAGHPHIHIVSVKVDRSGKRIDTQNIGKNQSEKARKNIEQAFGLVSAEAGKKEEMNITVGRLQYGKTETKRAISNVLAHVLKQYRFSSLPELNAVLKLYNVTADRGSETSRMYQGRGLVYRALDDSGRKTGVGIKASRFYMKPTLEKLEQLFAEHAPLKLPLRKRVKNAIDVAMLRHNPAKIDDLVKLLERDAIHAVLRQNDQGLIYGITYVDHKNKVVFNGSELGKTYSTKGIMERCGKEMPELSSRQDNKAEIRKQATQTNNEQQAVPSPGNTPAGKGLLETLVESEHTYQPVPYELKKARKKKKRKRLSDNR